MVDNPVLSPQFSVVDGPVITAVMAYAHARSPAHGPDDPVLPVSGERITAMLRALLPPPPPDFRLVAHGIRAGSATVLSAMGVPRPVIQAWGWWARAWADATDAHYAATCVGIMLAASRLMHRVVIRPVSPGFTELVSLGGPMPVWGAPSDADVMLPDASQPSPCAEHDQESSTDDESLAVRVVAPRQRASQAVRRRLPAARR